MSKFTLHGSLIMQGLHDHVNGQQVPLEHDGEQARKAVRLIFTIRSLDRARHCEAEIYRKSWLTLWFGVLAFQTRYRQHQQSRSHEDRMPSHSRVVEYGIGFDRISNNESVTSS